MSLKAQEILVRRIKDAGPVNIAEFMEAALYNPECGYYMHENPFGRGGDFITSPEISQMFGEMVGVWAVNMWEMLGYPDDFALVECGPGRGGLMADLLRGTSHVPGFHDAMRVYMVEVSPSLIEAQRKNIVGTDVCWVRDVNQLPEEIPVILIGNEFLDAIPVRQIIRKNGKWQEKCVDIDGSGGFIFASVDTDSNVECYMSDSSVSEVSDGDTVEISPLRFECFSSVCDLVQKQGGGALFIDYGSGGCFIGDSLQAVFSHKYCDVLSHIGEADITSHVDFGVLSQIATGKGLSVYGPEEQGSFLRKLGIDVRAWILAKSANEYQRNEIYSALERLVDDKEMGSLFKAIVVCGDVA